MHLGGIDINPVSIFSSSSSSLIIRVPINPKIQLSRTVSTYCNVAIYLSNGIQLELFAIILPSRCLKQPETRYNITFRTVKDNREHSLSLSYTSHSLRKRNEEEANVRIGRSN